MTSTMLLTWTKCRCGMFEKFHVGFTKIKVAKNYGFGGLLSWKKSKDVSLGVRKKSWRSR